MSPATRVSKHYHNEGRWVLNAVMGQIILVHLVYDTKEIAHHVVDAIRVWSTKTHGILVDRTIGPSRARHQAAPVVSMDTPPINNVAHPIEFSNNDRSYVWA